MYVTDLKFVEIESLGLYPTPVSCTYNDDVHVCKLCVRLTSVLSCPCNL